LARHAEIVSRRRRADFSAAAGQARWPGADVGAGAAEVAEEVGGDTSSAGPTAVSAVRAETSIETFTV
jgi:hypothetical protein